MDWTKLDTPMATKLKPGALETRSTRLKLPVAKKPVYVRIERGLNLGYRRNQGAGSWMMRVADGKGSSSIKAIGTADDLVPADGRTVLDFWQAQAQARKLFRPGQAFEDIVTVAGALDRYEEDLENRGKDRVNVSRTRSKIPVELGRKTLTELDAGELGKWRDGLLKKLAPAGVNRVLNSIRAAFNLAADHDKRIASRHAWQIGLAALPNGHNARNVILDDPVVRRLVAEAYAMDSSFGLLIETAAVTGSRSSQIARITGDDVRDDPPALYIPRSNKGRGEKATSHVSVPITAELLGKYDRTAAPLLTKKNGRPWGRTDHSQLFAQLARRCGLDPKEVTMYALRHSSIVRQLKRGVPIRVVAAIHDTSIVMIEKTYSRHIADHADALVRAALLV
jgi:integrase